LAVLYQNFFSSFVFSKYSFGENSQVIAIDRGSTSSSKCVTEREAREERRSDESEGCMYWSISGGACSRTRGQKLGIWETVAERRV
jgi:hypothetical protein